MIICIPASIAHGLLVSGSCYKIAKGRELINLIECTELTLAKTILEKIQMARLFNSQS